MFAIVKTAAIVMFIIVAILAIFGLFKGASHRLVVPKTVTEMFPLGWKGFLTAMIYAYYAFGGIEVIGLMSLQLKNKKDAPKAGKMMLLVLTGIYVVSIGLAVVMEHYTAFSKDESPFVQAMADYHLTFFPHVFNAAMIIAGFSTMTASLFGVTELLVTLAEEKHAPRFLSTKIKKMKNLPLASLCLGAIGLAISIVTAFLLPGKIYEYITTSAGILLLFNWFFIIISALKLMKLKWWGKGFAFLGMFFIGVAVSGTVLEKETRPALYVCCVVVLLIGIIFILKNRTRRGQNKKAASHD